MQQNIKSAYILSPKILQAVSSNAVPGCLSKIIILGVTVTN